MLLKSGMRGFLRPHLCAFPSFTGRKRTFQPQAAPQCSKRESDGKRDVCFSGSTLPSENFIYSTNLMEGLLCGRHCSRHQRDNCEYEKSLIMKLPTEDHGMRMGPQQESDKEKSEKPKKEGLLTTHLCTESQHSLKGQPREMVAECLHHSLAFE